MIVMILTDLLMLESHCLHRHCSTLPIIHEIFGDSLLLVRVPVDLRDVRRVDSFFGVCVQRPMLLHAQFLLGFWPCSVSANICMNRALIDTVNECCVGGMSTPAQMQLLRPQATGSCICLSPPGLLDTSHALLPLLRVQFWPPREAVIRN